MKRILILFTFITMLLSSVSYAGYHDVQDYWDPTQKQILPNIKKVAVFVKIPDFEYIGYVNTEDIVRQMAIEVLQKNGYQADDGQSIINEILENPSYKSQQERDEAFYQYMLQYDAAVVINVGQFNKVNGFATVLFYMKLVNTINDTTVFSRQEIRVSDNIDNIFKSPSAAGTGKRMINSFVQDFTKESKRTYEK